MDADQGDGASSPSLGQNSWICPIPMSHDRFNEAHYFLHRMEQTYHEPRPFRYNLNAFVSAHRAVHEMLRVELEAKGEIAWWRDRRREFADDDVLSRFAVGRNIVLHQRAILEGSQVGIGVFRGRTLKLAVMHDLQTDETSAALLLRMVPRILGGAGVLDEEHSAVGEQLGVQRLYFVKDLSQDEDVLRASRRALARTSGAVAEAHNRFGGQHEPTLEDTVLDGASIESINVLLETDLDPTAPTRWGWD